MLAHRHADFAVPPGRDRITPIFVDVVAVVEDEGQVLLRQITVCGVITGFVMLTAGDAEAQLLRRRRRERQRAGTAVDAFRAAGFEAVDIGPVGLQARDFDVDGMGDLRPSGRLALGHDVLEALVARDDPVHWHDAHAHAAVRLERLGSEAGPDDETIRRRIARGNTQAEWIMAPKALRADERWCGDERRGSCAEKMTTSEHRPPELTEECCSSKSPASSLRR